jgi:hypothetical protein
MHRTYYDHINITARVTPGYVRTASTSWGRVSCAMGQQPAGSNATALEEPFSTVVVHGRSGFALESNDAFAPEGMR